MKARVRKLSAIGACIALLTSCLPKDTRPPPSVVHVTVSPSEATRTGSFTTADGWTITLSRALLVIGRVSLDGDQCTGYSDAEYTRVLSLLGAPAEQKLSDAYALGHCSFSYAVTNPDSDSVLGVGATEADKTALDQQGYNPVSPSRTTLLLEGEAEKSGQHEQFSWRFGARARFSDCKLGTREGLDLVESGESRVDISLHAEAVFRQNLVSGNEDLEFGLIAAADTDSGNDDGTVTLEELAAEPLAPLLAAGTLATDNPAAPTWLTLADFVWQGAAPTIPRYQDTGECTLGSPNRRGR